MDLNPVLRRAVDLGASVIHFKVGKPPILRRDGSVGPLWNDWPLDPTMVLTPDVQPMASLVLAHRLAIALARLRGLDPDAPRNLTRSVVLQ